jgi:hypothetical protein
MKEESSVAIRAAFIAAMPDASIVGITARRRVPTSS